MQPSRPALLQQIADEHGTPCFVYFMDDVRARIDLLRRLFGGRFSVSYAVKANPNMELLRRLHGHADTLDISSGGELRRALEVGWAPELLSFTGPGKRSEELEAAVAAGISEIVVESVQEAVELDGIARRLGARQAVILRIAPARVPRGLGVNMAGRPSQFGVDEEAADDAVRAIQQLGNVDLAGFHIFSGTQCLHAESILENWGIYVEIFRRLAADHDVTPRRLIFGSSLGIPYHPGDVPLDLESIADRVNTLLDELRAEPRFANARFYLETGRFIVGEAGVFLTRVIRRKSSRGVEIGICDGGMNHHLGACGHLGSVLHRNYPISRLGDSPDTEARQPFDLMGPMCTSIDNLGRNVALERLEIGDVIAIGSSGAYGASASPVYFISHPAPRELMVEMVAGEPVVTDVSQIVASAQPELQRA